MAVGGKKLSPDPLTPREAHRHCECLPMMPSPMPISSAHLGLGIVLLVTILPL
jgi:hypothetical protein